MAVMGSNFNLGMQIEDRFKYYVGNHGLCYDYMILASVLSLYRAVRHLRYCHSLASKLHDLHGNKDVCL